MARGGVYGRPVRSARCLVLAVAFVLLCTAPALAGTVDLRSGPAWTVYATDPAGTPAPAALGAAGAPPSNPWTADISSIPGAAWVWEAGLTTATTGADLAERWFSLTVTLPGAPTTGSLAIAADDEASIIVNGTSVGTIGSTTDISLAGAANSSLHSFALGTALKAGANTITVRGKNGPASYAGGCGGLGCTYGQNFAGVVFGGSIAYSDPPAVPAVTVPPSVSGEAKAGGTLSCSTGSWSSSPTGFTITWLRNGAAVPGRDGAAYVVSAPDEGTTIACSVVARNAGGDSAASTSAGLAVPKPVVAAGPTTVAITQIATLPSPKACISRRRFPIRLRGVKANRIVRAKIKLNGKQVRNLTGRALGLPIDLRGLPRGTFTVEIATTNSAGRILVGKRTYRTCVPKR